MTLFSVEAKGVPVNQVATVGSDAGWTDRKYSASKRTFSSLLLVEAMAVATWQNFSNESTGSVAANGSGDEASDVFVEKAPLL